MKSKFYQRTLTVYETVPHFRKVLLGNKNFIKEQLQFIRRCDNFGKY